MHLWAEANFWGDMGGYLENSKKISPRCDFTRIIMQHFIIFSIWAQTLNKTDKHQKSRNFPQTLHGSK